MASLQEEKRGVCTGTDGALAVSLLPTAADSWPSWWLGPERESPGPRYPDVERPGGKAAGVGGGGASEKLWKADIRAHPLAGPSRCPGLAVQVPAACLGDQNHGPSQGTTALPQALK